MKKVSDAQFDKEEQKIVKFYEVLSKQPNEASYVRVILYMFLFICMIVAFIPAQVCYEDGEGIGSIVNSVSLLFCIASWAYMSPYQLVSHEHVTENVIDKLCYLPINYKVYRKHLFQILLTYLLKVTAVGLAIQIAVTLVAYRQLSIWNFLYIIGPMFLIPLIVNSIPILVRNRKYMCYTDKKTVK